MKFSKQAILGTSVFVGGSILLYATIQQISNNSENTQTISEKPALVEKNSTINKDTNVLTADIATEQRILQEKQKQREKLVEEQERQSQKFITEQQQEEINARARLAAENQLYPSGKPVSQPTANPNVSTKTNNNASENPNVTPITSNNYQAQQTKNQNIHYNQPTQSVNVEKKTISSPQKPAIEPIAEPTKPSQQINNQSMQTQTKKEQTTNDTNNAPPTKPIKYQVQHGEGLIQIAKKYHVPVSALAQANKLQTNSQLNIGQKITIPSKKQIARLEREAIEQEQARLEKLKAQQEKELKAQQEKQQKEQYKIAVQKLKEARKTVKETDAKGVFGVQIAIAVDEAKAKEIVKKLKSAGYQTRVSETSKGIRIVVGPEKGKIAALALKDKINADPRLDTSNAWVIYW